MCPRELEQLDIFCKAFVSPNLYIFGKADTEISERHPVDAVKSGFCVFHGVQGLPKRRVCARPGGPHRWATWTSISCMAAFFFPVWFDRMSSKVFCHRFGASFGIVLQFLGSHLEICKVSQNCSPSHAKLLFLQSRKCSIQCNFQILSSRELRDGFEEFLFMFWCAVWR